MLRYEEEWMSEVRPSTYITIVILSLGLGAMACGLPSSGGGQTDAGVGATEPPSSPTNGPQPQSAPPTAPSPSSASGACSNTYQPVVQGATWSYDVTGGTSGPTSYTDQISSVSGDSFILTTTTGDIVRDQRWSCTADGLVALDFGGGTATLAVADMSVVFDTTEATGVTLPSDISPGDTWSQTFTLEGTQNVTGDQAAKVTGTVKYDSTATGLESVTVPAGTFDTLRMEGPNSMDLSVEMSGFAVPMAITGTIVRWYAPGVGYVKSIETSNVFGTDVEITTELTSYNIP
jgi:DUF3108-like